MGIKKLSYVLAILFSITVIVSFVGSVFGKLKLRVIEDNTQHVWKRQNFELQNDSFSMCIRLGDKRWNKFNRIPIGKCKLVFYSVFNERFEKEIEILPKTKFTLDISEIYVSDYSQNLFLDSLTEINPLKIYVEEAVGWHHCENLYLISRKDSFYQIKYFSEKEFVVRDLSQKDLNQLKKIEKLLRTRDFTFVSSTSSLYRLSVGNKIVTSKMGGRDSIKKMLEGCVY